MPTEAFSYRGWMLFSLSFDNGDAFLRVPVLKHPDDVEDFSDWIDLVKRSTIRQAKTVDAHRAREWAEQWRP